MRDKRTRILIEAPICEMGDAAELSSLVKVDSGYLAEVTDGDSEPRFVISDIGETKSGNNIDYDREAFQLIADQVNSKNPTGYLGHIPDNQRDTAFPLPQVLWLGSNVVTGSDGKAHLVTKGYLIPEGNARTLIKRNVINSVSWAGDALLTPLKTGGYKMKDYVLESIDFSRKGREGLKGQSLVLVTEEINNRSKGGISKVEDNESYERIVSTLTLPDLKTHNPGLLRTIQEMTKDEVKDETTAAVAAKEVELEDKHTKAVADLPEVSVMAKIKEILGVEKIEDSVEALTTLLEKLDKTAKEAVRAWFDNEILAKKVPNEKARKLVSRLIPVTEMAGDWKTEKGIEKIKTDLETRVDDALENDDEIRMIVTEMGSGRGGLNLKNSRRDENNHSGNNDDDNKDSKYKATSNLSVEEVTVG